MMNVFIKSVYKWWLRFFFAWTGPRKSTARDPQMSYAGAVQRPGTVGFGGNVKLSLLSSVYPETNPCNILYVVSSGLSVKSQAWWETCRRRGVHLVWNQNGVAYPAWAPNDYQRLNARMSLCLRQADVVIYQSRFCQMTSDRFLGAPSAPSAIIYNAVDTELFSPGLKASRPLTLLIAGTHAHSGRVLSALEALAQVRQFDPAACLRIAGRLIWPQAETEVQEALRRLGLRDAVTMTGPFGPPQAPDVYRQADILLHLKHADPCPSVVIEAMACGLPVVGCDSGGVPELLGDQGGVLVSVPPDLDQIYTPSPEHVAAAVTRVRADLSSWGNGARRRAVEKFDKAQWLRAHTDIFERLVRS